ncbi:alpha-L-rhamnosidase [bacterium A37T11]|nr:alpha-L-rhamnosidase [bacterium A37T11]
MQTKNWTVILILIVFVFCTPDKEKPPITFATIEQGFKHVPDSIQTSVYWYWLSDNISKEGVIKDLQAMKRVGINRAFIGNIGLDDLPYGKIKLFSEEWWDITHTALKTASELGIEIGMFNSPGWSQSGGPWVKPNQAMRYLASTEQVFKGPLTIHQKLAKPAGDFQDERVIAFKAPRTYQSKLSDLKPRISASPQAAGAQAAMDGNINTVFQLSKTPEQTLTFQTDSDYQAESLTIYPAHTNLRMDVTLEAEIQGHYQAIKTFTVDRSNNAINVGFAPYAPVVVSFAPVSSKSFRILLRQASPGAGIAEIALSATPKVERYIEKTLAKMHPTPLPYWQDYQWPKQAEVSDPSLLVKETDVKDISQYLQPNGTLNWDVPSGEWVVMRTGMLPTGAKNSPASPQGTGLEIDKMNHAHAIPHFNAFLGEIQKRIPAADRKTFKLAVQDSYEMGGQNWTDDFIRKFQQQYGYDPTPYIPVFYGHVVGSQDRSDRFLWDLRRFVADKVAYEYVGGLRDISHKHGLNIWLENYGHWGFPGEFLQYGGQSDEIGGEFWSEGELGNIENRAASSAAHIYGKTKVSAESFTAGGKTFGRYPALFKQRGDRFFTEGINNTLLHVYIQQPYEDKQPGVNAWFGNEFNRFNTWFDDMDLFVQYLKRCNFLLQQGKYVADIAYFIGEDAPKMTGVQDPALPKGYAFDYINGEIIRDRLQVKNGRFVLPDGMTYKILVLPKLETIRPELLQKIAALVKAGGTVLGPRPSRSPSLQNYGKADRQVQALASDLWGNIDGKTIKKHPYGKGLVLDGIDLTQALQELGTIPDVKLEETDPTLYIHRTVPEGEIYFISNQQENPIRISPTFRVYGKIPELWNAIDASSRELSQYTNTSTTTTVPLQLAPFESAFIIFRNAAKGPSAQGKSNFPEPVKTVELDKPWSVRFDKESRGPEQPILFDKLTDWSQNPDTRIAHYSGKATYQQKFTAPTLQPGQQLWLDLGSLVAVAKVTVNGTYVGGVWTPPYKLNISKAVKPGENTLDIQVVNTWINRLIGDQQLPEAERNTWTLVNPYKANSPLQSAGLLGPVKLETYTY